jgi:hypothetical protein
LGKEGEELVVGIFVDVFVRRPVQGNEDVEQDDLFPRENVKIKSETAKLTRTIKVKK